MLVFVEYLYLMGLSLKFMVQTAITSLVPQTPSSFQLLAVRKSGERLISFLM